MNNGTLGNCHLKRTVSTVCKEKTDRRREKPGTIEMLNTSAHYRVM